MKTLATFVALVGLAVTSASFATGCGCDPASNSERAAVTFTPSTVQAIRTPATCGAAPAFTPKDTFDVVLTGDTHIAPPFTTIALHLTTAAADNSSVALTVNTPGPESTVTTATTDDGSVQFSFTTGSDSGELDANPLDSVVVSVVSLPTADGDPLSVELYLTFEDGRALDQVYSAPLTTTVVPCKS